MCKIPYFKSKPSISCFRCCCIKFVFDSVEIGKPVCVPVYRVTRGPHQGLHTCEYFRKHLQFCKKRRCLHFHIRNFVLHIFLTVSSNENNYLRNYEKRNFSQQHQGRLFIQAYSCRGSFTLQPLSIRELQYILCYIHPYTLLQFLSPHGTLPQYSVMYSTSI